MVTIRNAIDRDIPSILKLYDEQLTISVTEAEKQQDKSLDDYIRVFNEIKTLPGCELVIAEEDGEVIGTAMLMIVPNLSHKALPWAIIENVVVNEKHRRSGTGKLMMNYCEKKAKEVGCYKVQLLSSSSRKEAHEFYKSIGYRASAEGFRLYL
jgi:predicted N-acetyltransferase YhbS